MPGKIYKAPAASNPDTEVEDSEDTEEEEPLDTEEESTEDEEQETEEEESDSEETEDEEESTEESDEEKVEQHIDLKTVPPQLREAAKRMLASHTKAMQAIQGRVQVEIEKYKAGLEAEYSDAIVKSAAFQKIITWPGWEKYYDDVQNGRPYGSSSEFRSNGESKSKDASSASSDGKVSVEAIVQQLTPAIKKMIESEIGPMKQANAKSLWDDAEKNLPNFNMYKTKITAILTKYPSMSLDEAYQLAGGNKEAARKLIDDSKKIAKKLPKTLKPSGGGNRPLSDKVVKNIDDAISLAQRDHAAKK